MKVVFLTLLLGLICAAQEAPAELDPSEITGDWHSVLTAADNKEKIEEGGPLRAYIRRLECNDTCSSIGIKFYVKVDRTCLLFTEVAKRQEGDIYVTKCKGKNALQLIHVSDNMVVNYVENDDGDKITKMTEGVAKENSFTQEGLQKYQELNNENGVPNENTENLIKTSKAPEDNRYPK
ncbi:allergen Bos d 2-like [Dama dama]|uniref:allergen Bos d 2-like n=1 Tax=Dama dama TaxID=30532 RepID=UPI002A35A565|nr:allergen Bos d 2-like [Dama dama]